MREHVSDGYGIDEQDEEARRGNARETGREHPHPADPPVRRLLQQQQAQARKGAEQHHLAQVQDARDNLALAEGLHHARQRDVDAQDAGHSSLREGFGQPFAQELHQAFSSLMASPMMPCGRKIRIRTSIRKAMTSLS